ncbi:hypothetical protein N7730_10045 [Burkholderia cenocepacia]|nr:hypothetical protein [Burkholderia cenocepacia]MDT6994000.1 hypothetical protein [Burkholderia cenocepacia]
MNLRQFAGDPVDAIHDQRILRAILDIDESSVRADRRFGPAFRTLKFRVRRAHRLEERELPS